MFDVQSSYFRIPNSTFRLPYSTFNVGSSMLDVHFSISQSPTLVFFPPSHLRNFPSSSFFPLPHSQFRLPYLPIPPSPSLQPLVEPLSNRGLDVLDLLAQRLSNKEIAEKLYISAETVKSHLKNIYQKLTVSKRRQAIEKAKKIGIL